MGCSLRSEQFGAEPTLPRERHVDYECRRTRQIDRVAGVGLASHERQRDRAVIGRDDDRAELADDLLAEFELGPRLDRLAEPQAQQAPVRLAAVIEPGDGLLADVTTLREGHRALVEARLLGDDALVEVDAV